MLVKRQNNAQARRMEKNLSRISQYSVSIDR